MDLHEAERLIAERLAGRDSADVGVTVGVVPAGWLNVHVHSEHPVLWFQSEVQLHADGWVTLPPDNDGCTPIGTAHTLAGTAGTVAEAVDLVVAEAEKAIGYLEQRIADQLARNLPAAQPPVMTAELADACALWQGGRPRTPRPAERRLRRPGQASGPATCCLLEPLCCDIQRSSQSSRAG